MEFAPLVLSLARICNAIITYTDSFEYIFVTQIVFIFDNQRHRGIWVNPWVVWWVEGAQKDELAKTELMVAITIAEEPGKNGNPRFYRNHEILDKSLNI
jgi:hypothetical protein